VSPDPLPQATPHAPPVGERPPRRAVFLDRDGVIIEDRPTFIRRPDQVRLLDGVADAIRRLNDAGFLVVVVTNQSGVARGYLTEADVRQIHRHISALVMERAGARIDRVYYCPTHPAGVIPQYTRDSDLRKPAPGMLWQAARDLKLDLATCYLVGDAERDMIAARRAGVCAVLVLTGLRSSAYPSWSPAGRPDQVAADLGEAVRWILAASRRV
jgi:D-glycero-D-manno-heptose 1,7-bisphosphate phosphatase